MLRWISVSEFQFTGLIRGPTGYYIHIAYYRSVSIHRPHTRPDFHSVRRFTVNLVSIHRPHTRPDLFPMFVIRFFSCFNSQASYEARLTRIRIKQSPVIVSIHRPHTRPDNAVRMSWDSTSGFNSQASYEARLLGHRRTTGICAVSIHRPHTRPDDRWLIVAEYLREFQFTGLIRGPTRIIPRWTSRTTNFNSQASYEARR